MALMSSRDPRVEREAQVLAEYLIVGGARSEVIERYHLACEAHGLLPANSDDEVLRSIREHPWLVGPLEADPGSRTGDRLHVSVPPRPSAARRVREDQSVILKSLRKLGAYPLRVIDPGDGSSIHYGGTLPFVAHGTAAAPWNVDPSSGRLHGTARVFIADGSPFKILPAKGITLTLMAYADWVCRKLQ